MTNGSFHQFHRGEPIVIYRTVDFGDPTGVVLQAVLKKTHGFSVPKATVLPVATFDVAFEDAAGGVPARWRLEIPGSVTVAFQVGRYVTDAKFIMAGEVVKITDPAFISVLESVSA